MNSNNNLLHDKDLYFKKYLNYKKKYLKSNQYGGFGHSSEQYYIYFCFKKNKTDNALKILNEDYNTYDIKDIDYYLHAGAYKSNFSNELELVIAPNSEKKLKKSEKIVSKLFFETPLDKMKIISKITLLKIIKKIENKINKTDDKKEEKPEEQQKEGKPEEVQIESTPDEKKDKKDEKDQKDQKEKKEGEVQKGGTHDEDVFNICAVLVFSYNQKMSLILNYKVENNELIDQDAYDNFPIKIIDKIEPKKSSFFRK
jgi:hypothetical protein